MAQMSEQRLSKLQKWILENCFKVIVLLDRSGLKELKNVGTSWRCRECTKSSESVETERKYSFITHKCVKSDYDCPYFDFYKEDVLLSFFLLPPNNGIIHINRVQHFHDSPDYAKAHVTLHRSINNLVDKGFIFTFSTFKEYSVQIHLTDKGMEKAVELLKIGDSEFSNKLLMLNVNTSDI